MKKIYALLLLVLFFTSCEKVEEIPSYTHRYFIEWEDYYGSHNSRIIGAVKNSIPRIEVVEKNSLTLEYRLMVDSRILDTFTTIYPNHLKFEYGEKPFYIISFYAVN